MKVLFDPKTIEKINAAGPLLEGISDAATGIVNARQKASFLEGEIEQTRIDRNRRLRDLDKTKRATLARTFAVLAASGGGTGDPSTQAITQDQAAEFGVKSERVRQDAAVREATLRLLSKNTTRNSIFNALSSIFGGAAKAAKSPLFRSRPKTSTGRVRSPPRTTRTR